MNNRAQNVRRVWHVLAVLLPVAGLMLVLALAPAAAAKGRKKTKVSPYDLVIRKIEIKELPGNPPYVALDEKSRAPGFRIAVTTMNFGRKVGQTATDLTLESNGKVVFHGRAKLRPLGYRDSQRVTWVIQNLRAEPGYLVPYAKADATSLLDEKDEHNNLKSAPIIPVVPRQWKVDTFREIANTNGGVTETTQTANGLYFRLSRFDETEKDFVYQPYGQINSSADFVGAGCSGHGSAQATQTPWPGIGDELVVTGHLSAYSASVRTDGQPPFMFSLNCPGGVTFPQQGSWINLQTLTSDSSAARMNFDDRILEGDTTKETPVGPTRFTWHFVARISGA